MSFIEKAVPRVALIGVTIGAAALSKGESSDQEYFRQVTITSRLPAPEVQITQDTSAIVQMEEEKSPLAHFQNSTDVELEPVRTPQQETLILNFSEGTEIKFAEGIADQINKLRVENGSNPLESDQNLTEAAQEESELSVKLQINYGPEFEDLAKRTAQEVARDRGHQGDTDVIMRETYMNAVYNDPDTDKAAATFIQDLLVEIPGIKEKLLSTKYNRIGSNCYVGYQHEDARDPGKLENYYMVCVQFLGKKIEITVTPTASPSPRPALSETPEPSPQ